MVGPAALVEALSSLPKDATDPNSYSLIPVNAWSHNVSSVLHTARLLEAAGGFDIVLPHVLVERLVARTNRKEQCPMPRGPWSSDCLDCTLAGNGSCMLSCGNCAGRGAACDLAVCADGLSVRNGRFYCKDGSVCPDK